MSEPIISLGFTEQRFAAGAHVCQLYTDDAERLDSVVRFLSAGLDAGEYVACFSDHVKLEELVERLGRPDARAISVSPAAELYFAGDRFDPERMLGALADFHGRGRAQGHRASRVIGEMPARVRDVQGGNRLLEYEARVSILQRTCPVTAVCQYDARAFDGATILEILKVHPLMVLRGAVVQNPFFIEPEIYLRTCAGAVT